MLFLIQSLAGSAWAGIDMSMINGAEKTQMQMMHANMKMASDNFSCMHSNSDMSHLQNCCIDSCVDVLCLSFHSSTIYINNLNPVGLNDITIVSTVDLHGFEFNTRYTKPETPPPSSIA
ncbi:hypothetical protein J3998_11960 [Thiomicrorhabdus sp. 6S2-11]|jgi:hypothetical protein|uniref:Uncharacterized protein n=1 Tax=Thiomicrorhabdus marina TaxID=2818442 RepID=A0ABS3Q7G2_9GAMM|nr:hypothetical protein [Thiomicrorhabdus marina]MBO1928288.1 hypothetical protein [Thiomicrorhabdus marina]